jgi:hypothetical protein
MMPRRQERGSTGAAVRRLARCYRVLLRCYPESYRRSYGAQLEQLFRDQCRDALEGDLGRVCRFVCFILSDFVSSSLREHLSQLLDTLKPTDPMNPTAFPVRLPHLLLAGAIACALAANPGAVGPAAATACAVVSAAALFARAVLEWFRPPGRGLGPIAWGVAILVAYGLIVPAWAKLGIIESEAAPAATVLLLAPIFLNTLVPAFRAFIHRFGRAG